ncbi:MAG: response regulator transcription factor [Desulfocapsaceae bacterium]|nr:response regulator transcription factor [Desulfocapsaceae bacterium]
MDTKILIIDDDVELCDLLTEYLQPEGFAIEGVHDGKNGLARALSEEYSFIVLDVMLPGIDGFEVLKQFRTFSSTPVIMLTARGDDIDRIIGLELGADDYLSKPFNPRELLARLRAIQRRIAEVSDSRYSKAKYKQLSVGDIVLDPYTMRVYRNGDEIGITAAEFSLLRELLLSVGKVVSREELANNIFGRKLAMFDRSIDVHIASLRKKLGHEVNGHERIKTIRGAGYMYTGVGLNEPHDVTR